MKTIFTFPHKRGFILFPVMLFIFLFMGMVLIEFEEMQSLFFVQQLEQEKNNTESEQELLHNIVSYEVEELKKYLCDVDEELADAEKEYLDLAATGFDIIYI